MKEIGSVVRSFVRVYEDKDKLDLTGALNIIMEEICDEGTEVTEEMLEKAKAILEGDKGKK